MSNTPASNGEHVFPTNTQSNQTPPRQTYAAVASNDANNAPGVGSVKRARTPTATQNRLRAGLGDDSDDDADTAPRGPLRGLGGDSDSDSDAEEDAELVKRVHRDDAHGNSMVSLSSPAADSGDAGFMGLLQAFSETLALDPRYYSVEEECPVCGTVVATAAFAEHLNVCLVSLEAEEQAQLERMDHRLAMKLAAGDSAADQAAAGAMGDDGEAEMSLLAQQSQVMSRLLGKPAAKPACPQGAGCMVTAGAHYAKFTHPPSLCPLCELQLPLYEMAAHVAGCLDTPEHLRLGVQQRRQRERDAGGVHATGRPADVDGDVRMQSRNRLRGAAADDDDDEDGLGAVRASDPLLDSDSDSDDDVADDGGATAMRSSAVSRRPAPLPSVGQLGAMARAVLSRAGQSAGPDPDLGALLRTFNGLGLTREAVDDATRRLREEREGKDKGDGQ